LYLAGAKNDNKNNNKIQIIILELLKHFPGKDYYYFINNLFISEYFLKLLYTKGYGTIRICWTNTGIISKLIILKKIKKNKIFYKELFG
jgi:hypothetical protein